MNLDRFTNRYDQTNRLLGQEYDVFLAHSRGPAVDRWAASYLRIKLGNRPVRAQFAAAMSDWLLGLQAPWHRWTLSAPTRRLLATQIPFIFEVVISIQYLHNQIIDSKAGVSTRSRIVDNLLLANLLKDQLYRYIDAEVPGRYRSLVTAQVRECFEWVDLGQQLERQANNYARMHQHELVELLPASLRQEIDLQPIQAFIDKTKQELPRFLHTELNHYFHRIYLTCAALFVGITRLTGRILQVPAVRLRAPLQFSVCYGIMRQLVNDNADWVSTTEGLHTQEKHTADVGSDLRNKTLTLPLFFWLAEVRSEGGVIGQVLQDKRAWAPELQPLIFQEMLETHALFRSVQHTRILATLAEAYLPFGRTDLAEACQIAHWNKFLVPVLRHPAYQHFRKTPTHRRTKQLIKQLRRLGREPADKGTRWSLSLPWQTATSTTPSLPSSVQRALFLLRG